ncbi:MAG: glutamate mutase L [Anaerolineae bacterium]|nr:glutamate mutase L [Anaerolineae bacterium]
MTSVVDADSLLAIDIGSVNTRALLFDAVDGQYHFLAAGAAPSTWGAPFFDIGEGVHLAVTRLQEITSRPLLNSENRIQIPTQPDGSGVDKLVVTLSAGRDVRILIMGLLADVSLESARHLASTTYGTVIEAISLNDTRRQDVQLDAILQANADLVILAGGTERGSTRSVSKMVELALLASRTLPSDKRPRIIYCGNQLLAKKIQEVVGRYTEVQVTPNIRPTIDLEDLEPAQDTLTRTVTSLRGQQMGGLDQLSLVSAAPITQNANAMGRLMRFLSELYDPIKGVLGVDLGASSTTLAAAMGGKLHLNVFRPMGLGAGMEGLLKTLEPADLLRWLPMDVTPSDAMDYLWQKTLYPSSLPLTTTTLAIELAAAREILRRTSDQMLERYPQLNMSFEPIFAGGAVFAHAASPGQALLTLLDGLQPHGLTTLFVDPYGLMSALGAVAPANSLLPVQILESGAFQNLGAVICPVSSARPGTVILRARLVFDDGNETRVDVKQGSLVPLPVRHGQTARLYLEAQRGTEIDPRRRTSGGFKIIGGVCGALIDARGRPLALPEDSGKRKETLLRWSQVVDSRRQA